MIDPAIFREYDIRGVTTQNFTVETVRLIGRAFGEKAGGTVVIARDGRLSSPALSEALATGLREGGSDVVDIGVGPTPMLYYATTTLKATGGVMLTGSHNPIDHNGLKFMLHGKAFYGADIQALREKIMGGGVGFWGKGNYSTLNIQEEYLEVLLKAYTGKPEIKVVWDAGNGATGNIVRELCERLPGVHFPMYDTIDGTFPNHHPDPTKPKNLTDLIAKVKKEHCDLGIAFDGDGDRIGVVDNKGHILSGDQLLMLYAADVLKDNPGATIISCVKTSSALMEEIILLGGTPMLWKTGHSNIKSKMAEIGAPFAGELSGHMFFADKYYGYDDALYAAIRLLNILSHSNGATLSGLCNALPTRESTPEIRFHCDDNRKFAVIDEIKARLKEAGSDFLDIDGVRVGTHEGWWLVRASNTEPMLVARAEAQNYSDLERLKESLRNQLALSNVALP